MSILDKRLTIILSTLLSLEAIAKVVLNTTLAFAHLGMHH